MFYICTIKNWDKFQIYNIMKGGKREGAGRPVVEQKKVPLTIYVKKEKREQLKKLFNKIKNE